MPTSAAGNKGGGSRPARHRLRVTGFTVIELLVVVAIIAFSTAGVAFALRDSAQAPLEREAQRLAALLESARAQSRANGYAVRWYPTPQGFAFDGLPAGVLPTHWTLAAVQAQPLDARGLPVPALQLGPDPIVGAQQLLLSTDDPAMGRVRLSTDGLRPFTAQVQP